MLELKPGEWRVGVSKKSVLLLALFLSVLGLTATAHPFDADYYSSRAEVKAGAEGVSIVVVVEVPTRNILETFLELYGDPTQIDESSDEIFRQRQFEEMAGQLRLRKGGRPLPGTWQPVKSEANGRGTDTFFVYLLEFIPEDPQQLLEQRLDLRLDMEVFPRDFIYLSASVEVVSPWRIVKNSADSILSARMTIYSIPRQGGGRLTPGCAGSS